VSADDAPDAGIEDAASSPWDAEAPSPGDATAPPELPLPGPDTAPPAPDADQPTGCPEAVIQVAEGEEVAPQTVLHLDGTASVGAQGAIVAWAWEVEEFPAWCEPVLIPSPTFPKPTAEVNCAGTYRFRLQVQDASGAWSCIPATAEVVVVPCCGGFHVELLWDTPGDPDPTDGGPEAGTDLDLHLTHPYAGGTDQDGDGVPDGWFDIPFDCFWFNAKPDWGSMDPSVNDNPSLDRDDTDGMGPENINLHGPEAVTYRVGVHAFNDHGYGPSTVTVRVFMWGNLVFEVSGAVLTSGDLWEVCTIEWPAGKVSLLQAVDGGFRIIPVYQNLWY
jgi:hypothetical protein